MADLACVHEAEAALAVPYMVTLQSQTWRLGHKSLQRAPAPVERLCTCTVFLNAQTIVLQAMWICLI